MVLLAVGMFFGISQMQQSVAGAVGTGAGFVYLIGAIIVFFLNKYLFDYAAGIKAYFINNESISIEKAFKMQKKYWKLKGIVFIVYISLFVLALIFTIGATAMFP